MNLECIEEATSTHDLVLGRMRDGAPHGTALLAERQTAGRGRRGRTWESPSGSGLYLSLGLRHPGLPPRLGWLPILAGLEAATLLDPDRRFGVGLKWPNDLFVQDRKLGGLLAESAEDSRGDRVVALGIGINLVTPEGGWSNTLQGRAIAADEARMMLDEPRRLAQRLVGCFLDLSDQLSTGLPPQWRDRWRERDVTRGRRVRIDGDPARVGIAVDIDTDGALLCRNDEGSLFRVVAGEVTWDQTGTGTTSDGPALAISRMHG